MVAGLLRVQGEGGEMKVMQLALAAGIVMAASSAHAVVTTYDFDGFADGTDLSTVDLGDAAASGGIVNGGAASATGPVTFNLNDALLISGVSVDVTSSDDQDSFFINAFQADGSLMFNFGVSTASAGGQLSFNTLAAIASVEFGSNSGGAFTFDNLSIDAASPAETGDNSSQAAVPVPAALPLMGTALAGVAYLGLRRRSK